MLKEVARGLTASIRASDILARVGGDEFALLLIGASARDSARLADGLRAALATRGIPASAGAVPVVAGVSPETLRAMADQAMYENRRLTR